MSAPVTTAVSALAPLSPAPVVFVIAAPTFAAVELGGVVFTSALAPAPPTCGSTCGPTIPLLPPPLALAVFPTPLPRPRSAHGLLTGGGAGTGPDIAGAGAVDADVDDVVEEADGRDVDSEVAFDVFEAEIDLEFELEVKTAERSREVGVDVDVLEVEGAGERI